ncbi:hypothetical protein LCGC14_0735360 [marine sediment metagenome]|uniref:Uncharacterized protein n=1 Tax=marine sediment metagenome TaxID=412755 RepID=A0A0F9STE5_9ZZZZ
MWPCKKKEESNQIADRVVHDAMSLGIAIDDPPIEPPEYICDKCYGTFQEKGITMVPIVALCFTPGTTAKFSVLVEDEYYCTACAPGSEFILKLADKDGDLETRGFIISEGWLQDRDIETRKNRYVMDEELYMRMHCDFCGLPVEVKGDNCGDCTKREKKDK